MRSAVGLLAGIYAAQFGAVALLGPLAPLAFLEMGLSAGAIATLATLATLGRVLAPLWVGRWADERGRRKVLLVLAMSSLPLALFPLLGLKGLLLYPLLMTVLASQVPLVDVLAHDALAPDTSRFGYMRLWGSIGFATVMFGSGLTGITSRPVLLFACGGLLQLCVFGAALGLPAERSGGPKVSWREILSATRGSGLERFFLASGLHYVGFGVYDAYFALRLDSLGYGDAVGPAIAIGVVAEVAIMGLGPRLVRRVGVDGARWLAVAGAGAGFLRWAVVANCSQPELILLAQPLHAVSFGVWYLAVVAYVQGRAPEHMKASLQGGAATAVGAGALLGTAGGGLMTAHVSAAAAFGFAMLSSLAAVVLYLRVSPSESESPA